MGTSNSHIDAILVTDGNPLKLRDLIFAHTVHSLRAAVSVYRLGGVIQQVERVLSIERELSWYVPDKQPREQISVSMQPEESMWVRTLPPHQDTLRALIDDRPWVYFGGGEAYVNHYDIVGCTVNCLLIHTHWRGPQFSFGQ